jgi:23S rRNA pseudouridine1911/1915/1917 synthase
MAGSITRPSPPDDGGTVAEAAVPEGRAGERLDRVLADLFADFSRTRLGNLARAGRVLVDGHPRRPSWRVAGGERLRLLLPPVAGPGPDRPEFRPLVLVHEDEDLLVLDKPAGLSVHPGAGRPNGTLLNALLAHDPALIALPRAGLVHRLDRDTTGLLLVARTPFAYRRLVADLAARSIHRGYDALVWGVPPAAGTIDAPLARHPRLRTRRAVIAGGKPARTHFVRRGASAGLALLALRLDTGRTHQIRVHLAHLGHPVVGDPVYGGRRALSPELSADAREALAALRRQMLHAARLGFVHPRDGRPRRFAAPWPADMARILALLGLDVASREEAFPPS